MLWYECSVRFARGKAFICDVKARSESEARTKAKLLAVTHGFTEVVKKIDVKQLKG